MRLLLAGWFDDDRPDHTEVGLVTCQEIAAMLGVSRQRAFQLTMKVDFPEPRYRLLGGRKLWERDKIEAWVARRCRGVIGRWRRWRNDRWRQRLGWRKIDGWWIWR